MQLYQYPVSPNAYKVVAVANELGLTLETKMVDLLKGEQQTPQYTKLNPNQMMPTLVDADFVLWESNAIMQYLCSKVATQTLWPKDARAQANVARWQFWQTAHWMPACGTYLWENFVKGMANLGAPDVAALKVAEEKFHRFAPVLNGALEGNTWLCGEIYTLADFSIAAPLHYAQSAKLPLENYPHIRAWYDRVANIPAWEKAVPT